METENLYDDIVSMLEMIRNDENKLGRVLTCIENEVMGAGRVIKEETMPEKYDEVIGQITDQMDSGFVAFLNPDTLEMEVMSKSDFYTSEIYEEQHDDRLDEFDMNYYNWDRMVKFEPFNTEEYYGMMESFVNDLDDEKWRPRLEDALSQNRPAEVFHKILENSDMESRWDDYKMSYIGNFVKDRLLQELPIGVEENEDTFAAGATDREDEFQMEL